MKKLIAMIGAVAMSFGLFAAAPASFSISFETAETPKGVDTSSMLFTPPVNDGEWVWTGVDPLPLTAYGDEMKFAYGTGALARRVGFDGEDANANYLPLSTGTDELVRSVGTDNLCLDQLVKFTGFEDPQTNLTAGTKIAVWMSEFENDDESTTTNLYVTVGKVDALGAVKQIALKVDGEYALNTWYRLTIKSLGNVFGTSQEVAPHAGFLVYVNGRKVASLDEDAKALIATTTYMTPAIKKYMDAGQLFTSIAADATFTSVGYQGIGAVDDIFIDANGPEFTVETVDVGFTTINGAVIAKVEDTNGVVTPNPDGTYSVKPGTLTVTLAAAPGYKLFGTLTYNVSTDDAVEGVINIAAGETTAELVVAKLTPVVGNPTYLAEKELYAALPRFADGEKIEFVKGCSVTNGEEEVLYTFTSNTTINVTAAGWDVFVGNYIDGVETVAGKIEVKTAVAAGKTLAVTFESDEDGKLTIAATVNGILTATNGTTSLSANIELGESAILKASNISFGTGFKKNAITLVAGAKVMTKNSALTATQIRVPENYTLGKQGPDAGGYYTYSAAQSEPPAPTVDTVTFTVTYDDAQVENVTVKTNGADVVKLGGLAYVVESNAVVTVAATAKAGYQNVTITGNNVTVDNGVFTADKAESAITIVAIPTYTVAAISVANASVVATNKTAGGATFALPADLLRGTEIAVTVTPNATYEYKSAPAGWTKNADGSITTNATVTADLTITVAAPTAAITPVEPETPKNYDSKEAADAAAAAINANKETMIKTPEGAVAKDYTDLFTAVVKANNAVVVELNEGGTNALKTAADTIETAVATKLDDIAAATAGSSVSVTVTVDVKNGFWYGVAATTDLTKMGSTEPTKWVQAKNGSVTIQATKPETGNAAFFQTRVKVK